MAIGKRLRDIRQAKGLTLEEVGAEINFSQPYLSKVERDRSRPTPETFELIASTVGVPEDLLDELRDELLFERDRAELDKLGFGEGVARLAAALERLDEESRGVILDRALAEVSQAFPSASLAAEAAEGDD